MPTTKLGNDTPMMLTNCSPSEYHRPLWIAVITPSGMSARAIVGKAMWRRYSRRPPPSAAPMAGSQLSCTEKTMMRMMPAQ